MTSPLSWWFRPLPEDGERTYGDAASFAFTAGLDAVAREVAQNSTDAVRDGFDTVELKAAFIDLDGDPLARFLELIRWDEIRPHLEAAADHPRSGQAARSIRPGLEELDKGTLRILRLSDFGTTGLTGDERGDSKFAAVMRNKLDSNKDDTAGGSFGLGKSVMWAASQFGLVLMVSNLETPLDGGRQQGRFLGRLALPYHEIDGVEWDGPAFIGSATNGPTESYWADEELLRDLMLDRGVESGTTFLVVGCHDLSGESHTSEEMAMAFRRGAIESFWPAMVERPETGEPLLRCVVGHGRNNRLSETEVEPSATHGPQVGMLQAYYDSSLVKELHQPGEVLQVSPNPLLRLPVRRATPNGELRHKELDHDARLLVTLAGDEDAGPANTVSYMRGKYMVVRRQEIHGLSVGAPPFHAVVLAGAAAAESRDDVDAIAAERFLRAAEPPEHNDWTGTRELTNLYKRGGPTYIRNFFDDVRASLRELFKVTSGEPPERGPEPVRELMKIPQRPKPGERSPAVKTLEGEVLADGRWRVTVEITLPKAKVKLRSRLRAVPKFVTTSRKDVRIGWDEPVVAVRNCTVESDDLILPTIGKKTIVFSGTCSATDLPVGSRRAAIRVDVVSYELSDEGTEDSDG